jgi:pimeloyl-ACP methyl ester carboxylesterase
MPHITINGVKLFWERTCNSGEPLILVHGSWIDHHTWDPVVPYLSRSFQVFTYDRRGHSQSEWLPSPGSIREDVAGLRRFPHPALLMRGEEGPPFWAPIIDKLAKALPQAELWTFPGAVHEPEQAHPELYAAAVAGFVTRVRV